MSRISQLQNGLAKRLCDVLLSSLLIILLLPILIIISLIIWVDSKTPIIYERRVCRKGGGTFGAFKFRTMVVNADEVLAQYPELFTEYRKNIKLKNDPRVTRVGHWLRKSSLDELPQLFNVLRGEMSLVGPRIITHEELEKYGIYAAKRLAIKPGITGLWQVSGRQDLDYQRRIELDMEYVDNWSFWLDIVILLKTIPAVLTRRGAY